MTWWDPIPTCHGSGHFQSWKLCWQRQEDGRDLPFNWSKENREWFKLKKLQNLVQSLEQHSSKIGLTQVVNTAKLDTLPVVDTRFGCFPVGCFGSYQLIFTESIFSFTSSFEGFRAADHCTATEFPPYPSFPLGDCNGSLITPDTLSNNEKELLESLRVSVIDTSKLEEKTRDQAECGERTRERKLRFMASNFGKISRRRRNH